VREDVTGAADFALSLCFGCEGARLCARLELKFELRVKSLRPFSRSGLRLSVKELLGLHRDDFRDITILVGLSFVVSGRVAGLWFRRPGLQVQQIKTNGSCLCSTL